MGTTLDYAAPAIKTPPRLWPAAIVALVGCPAASVATAVLGFQQALGSGWLSPANFHDGVLWGLVAGVVGGVVVAGIARAFRSRATVISIVGSAVVSGGSGVLLFLLVSMTADSA